jgi:diketogulonate reductase-like aldo/keto reductase
MGEQKGAVEAEVAALRAGVALGMTLIDTAEMYGEGAAEKLIGQALSAERDRLFLVSKVYPHNAGRKAAIAACERSLKRLRTDHLDLYLLHWRGAIPLQQTVDAFEALRRDGRIRAWGVSNFGHDDMREVATLRGGGECSVNQVLYNLECRGIEWDLLPYCRRKRIVVMAYSPLGQGRLLRRRELSRIARSAQVTPGQLALSWTLSQPGVIAIPKSASEAHVRENARAAELQLDDDVLRELDAAFPPPTEPQPLAML